MSGRISSPNLASLFREAGDRWGDKPAFATRQSDGSFRSVTYRAWRDRALDLAEALIELGVGARDHVAILSDNRFEWILADAAILFCGAADVPRAADITNAEITYILGHADVSVVFVENATVLAKLEPLLPGLPRVRHLIVMDPSWNPSAKDERIIRLADLEQRGALLRQGESRLAEERIGGVMPDDLFTIIYTSGTTGTPKGVQLTHAAMASQVRNLPFDLNPADRSLSILPVWHSFERVFEVISIAAGLETCYTSLRYLGEDLKTVGPTIMASAPRLWEGLYQRVISGVQKAHPLRRGLFRAACFTADAVRRARSFFTRQELDLSGRSAIDTALLAVRYALTWGILLLPSLLLDRIVLSKIRMAVGGRLRGTISGGGALPPHVDAFFNDIGIPVLEGYGLTESCPVLAVRTWERLVIGTVGPAFPETEIRIVDPASGQILYPDSSRSDLGLGLRGEIHARGPQIMKGYYKDPEATARVLRDGWLATGDLGVMTFNECLKIVGRCKETIVLLGGENVEPLPIESKLLESPLIDQCMVVGQDQKHL
ncbi:MAG: long-chain fatty acid--CoA ligase, partial [Proteobacteria bacterium]|nr:long-chain fatty acid--CoA ligase [Pseudomonadota bacterium]